MTKTPKIARAVIGSHFARLSAAFDTVSHCILCHRLWHGQMTMTVHVPGLNFTHLGIHAVYCDKVSFWLLTSINLLVSAQPPTD